MLPTVQADTMHHSELKEWVPGSRGLTFLQTCLGDIAGLVPGHRNKAGVAIKRVTMFLLVDYLAFNFKGKKKKSKPTAEETVEQL